MLVIGEELGYLLGYRFLLYDFIVLDIDNHLGLHRESPSERSDGKLITRFILGLDVGQLGLVYSLVLLAHVAVQEEFHLLLFFQRTALFGLGVVLFWRALPRNRWASEPFYDIVGSFELVPLIELVYILLDDVIILLSKRALHWIESFYK